MRIKYPDNTEYFLDPRFIDRLYDRIIQLIKNDNDIEEEIERLEILANLCTVDENSRREFYVNEHSKYIYPIKEMNLTLFGLKEVTEYFSSGIWL